MIAVTVFAVYIEFINHPSIHFRLFMLLCSAVNMDLTLCVWVGECWLIKICEMFNSLAKYLSFHLKTLLIATVLYWKYKHINWVFWLVKYIHQLWIAYRKPQIKSILHLCQCLPIALSFLNPHIFRTGKKF